MGTDNSDGQREPKKPQLQNERGTRVGEPRSIFDASYGPPADWSAKKPTLTKPYVKTVPAEPKAVMDNWIIAANRPPKPKKSR